VVAGQDADEYARRLAAESFADGSATAWFERLYVAAQSGAAVVPWDIGEPHFLLAEWAHRRHLDGTGSRALVIGCGLGRDAEFLAGFGYDTTAFDVSPAAVEQARRRHAGSSVCYRTADLLDPPADWLHAFDFVLESLTVQSLPVALRTHAIAQVPRLVGPAGTLLTVAAGRGADEPLAAGPPWPLTRTEVELFATDGVQPVLIEELVDEATPPQRRWRAEFRRPQH
jgi:SAM-dependent methyltransferase